VALRASTFSHFISLKNGITEFEFVEFVFRVQEHESTSSLFFSHSFSLASYAVLDYDIQTSRLGLGLEPDFSIGFLTLKTSFDKVKIFGAIKGVDSVRSLLHVIFVGAV
jgi:hypothetical protein